MDIVGSSSGEDYTEFNSLEERIIRTKRDHDEETYISVRPYKWQDMLIQLLSVKLGTNKTEVVNRAFTEGLSVVRDEIGWKNLEPLFQMKMRMIQVDMDCDWDDDMKRVSLSEINSVNMDIIFDSGYELGEPRSMPVERSVASEIDEYFVQRSDISMSDIARVVISAGLLNSVNIEGEYESNARESIDDVHKAVNKVRATLESGFFVMLSGMYGDGYKPKENVMGYMEAFLENMQSERKEKCEELLEKLKEMED